MERQRDRYKPTKILDHVIAVSLGYCHSGAITQDGSLYMWGSNDSGQIGDGTTEDRYKPTKILDHVIAVSLGSKSQWSNYTGWQFVYVGIE